MLSGGCVLNILKSVYRLLNRRTMKKILYTFAAAGLFVLASCESNTQTTTEDRVEEMEDDAEQAAEELEDNAETMEDTTTVIQ